MSNEMNQQPRKRGPMGRMGRGMQPGEKPKDLKKSIKQLAQYIGKYKIAIFIVMICAACSTVFNVAGPKILGKATTALSEGLMEKIRGTGSIDFAVCTWPVSDERPVQLHPGMDHDGRDAEGVLSASKRDFGEDQPYADEIF